MASAKKSLQASAALEEEFVHRPLELKGEIPNWLQGTLIRNGPVYVTVNGESNEHWFDGLAMLHAFSFREGRVIYTNKFLRTDAYREVFDKGSLRYIGFAVDPCRSLFKRFFTWFFAHRPDVNNANINVAKLAEQYVALTEIPLPVEFDPKTLETLGVFDYQDHLPKENCWEAAHPHPSEQRKDTTSYLVRFGRHTDYVIYHIVDGSAERKVIAEIPVDEPAYMHSFAVTEHYVILVEFPLVVKPFNLMLRGKPFIKNYHWKPERGTNFLVINRETGKLVGKYPTKPFFAFHHSNAFEKGDVLYLDIVCYDDAQIVTTISDYDRPTGSNQEQNPKAPKRFERFSLSLKSGQLTSETLFDQPQEFPRINMAYDGLPYRFAYLTDVSEPNENQDLRPLYKLDTETRQFKQWAEKGCYPGEAVFAASPNAQSEDDGVVLAVVEDKVHRNSFLLILDAKSFQEMGRAIVPHIIPAGLHGQYFS